MSSICFFFQFEVFSWNDFKLEANVFEHLWVEFLNFLSKDEDIQVLG